jgi:hypothetical protein
MIHTAYEMAAETPAYMTPASKLGIKLAVPTYDGSTSLAEFKQYVASMLRYLRIPENLMCL